LELLVALVSYYGVILLHECGHMVAAQRKGCRVNWIRLYPILGLVCFEQPYSQYDRAVIAWAGIVAQSLVAIPIVVWLSIFGYSRFDALNVGLGIWGYMSLGFAMLNVIPVPPLDGALAWKLFPELLRRSGIGSKGERTTKIRTDFEAINGWWRISTTLPSTLRHNVSKSRRGFV